MLKSRLWFTTLLLAALASALAPAADAARTPKSTVPPLGSHRSIDDQNARLAVLKQRSQVLNRSDAKPGKTVQSLNRHPGKTLGLSSSATK